MDKYIFKIDISKFTLVQVICVDKMDGNLLELFELQNIDD